MRNIHFFALREDLLAMLKLVESEGSLKYALTGNYLEDELNDGIRVYNAGAELPNLGTASGDSSTISERFLVCEREAEINIERFQGNDGERGSLDQLANPDSVVFLPGGEWNDNVVIQGHVGTASDSQISQAIMKRFHAAVKKSFTKVKAFYVGPGAFESLESGKRLTSSARSPREYDLALT